MSSHPRPGRPAIRAAAALTVAVLAALAAGCGRGHGGAAGQEPARPAGQPGGGGSTGPTVPPANPPWVQPTATQPTASPPAGTPPAGTRAAGTRATGAGPARSRASTVAGRAANARSIRILSPAEGATVGRTFGVRLDVRGFALREPDGNLGNTSGHLYVIVDGSPPPPNRPVRPGSGPIRVTAERTTLRNLRPGRHTITVVGANGYTVPFSPPVSAMRTVNVAG